MKSAWFHAWNLLDFMKFTWFHDEICQISPWNPPDFMNSGFCQYRYTWMSLLHAKYAVYISPCHEIHQISWWNLPDFMNSGFCSIFCKTNTDIYKSLFHSRFFFRTNTDIQARVLVYHWMLYFSSEPKSLAWNLPDFMKSTGFHHEICQISPWNPLDFMNSGFFFRTNTDIMLNRQDSWSTTDI